MFINNTYRNCQNLINIAGSFIMKNKKGQIAKKLKSNTDNIESPIEFFYYKDDIELATRKAIGSLKKYNCKNIAILGRNNSDIKKYGYNKTTSEVDLTKKFKFNVLFTTVHKSKGREFDGVIICNMHNYIAGFPNKMSDDPILDYVTLSKDDYLYEEERRLFYVALTRTKTKCMLLVPIDNPSIFIEELYELSDESIKKNIIEDDEKLHNPMCPKCKKGILVSRTNQNDNSVFVGCSNYPFCDFRHNDIDMIKNPIECPRCGSYMVERNSMYGSFYGCKNYPFCKQTINNISNNKQTNYHKDYSNNYTNRYGYLDYLYEYNPYNYTKHKCSEDYEDDSDDYEDDYDDNLDIYDNEEYISFNDPGNGVLYNKEEPYDEDNIDPDYYYEDDDYDDY